MFYNKSSCFIINNLRIQLQSVEKISIISIQNITKNGICGIRTHAHICGTDLESDALDHSAKIPVDQI
jgi:hypothetical protein